MVSPTKWASAIALTMLGVPSLALGQTAPATEGAAPAAPAAEAAPAEEAPAEPAPEPSPEPAPVAATLSADAGVAATTAAPAPAPAEAKPEDDAPKTDHDGVVGHFGVGLLGMASVSTLNPDFSTNDVTLPMVGARYWLNERLGLQAGLGMFHQSGDNNQSTQEFGYDTPTMWGLGVHVGVPYAFFYDKHYTLIAQPEANFVFGTGRVNDNQNINADQATQSGAWGLDVGARIGAEVQFGFIGIPKLALQGSVGISYQLRQAQLKTFEGPQNEEVNRTVTRHSLGTAHNNDPWDLFTSSIAALYYF